MSLQTPLELTIELIPSTSWYNNMRSVMSKQQWDTLRRKVYADYNHQRGICGMTNVTIQHFMKVNNCDRQIFESHRNEAFQIWEERSKH